MSLAMPLAALLALWTPAAWALPDQTTFTTEVQTSLARAHPECLVELKEALALHLTCGDTELDVLLARVYRACDRAPASCELEKQGLLAGVAEALAPEVPPKVEDLLPAVRSRAYLAALPPEATERIIAEPIAADLVMVWMVDAPTSARSLTPAIAESLGLDPATLKARGYANLERQLAILGDVDSRGYHVLSGSYYTSSALLLPERWAALGETVYAMVPTHELVLYTTSAKGLRKMKKAAERLAKGGDGALSAAVLRWEAGRWVEAE